MYMYVCQNLDCKEYFFINYFPPPPHTHLYLLPVSILWEWKLHRHFLITSQWYVLTEEKAKLTGERQLKSRALTWLRPPFPEQLLSPFLAICVRARSAMSLQVQRWSCWEEQSPHLPCLVIKVLVLHHHPSHVVMRHQLHSRPLEMARESLHHLIFILSFKLESHKVTVKSLKMSTSNCPCVCVSMWSVF